MAEVGLRGALQALSPQEDCEFYLTAQQFMVLPMQRQRMESSDGYGPWDGWGLCPGGLLHLPHSSADPGSPDVTCLWQSHLKEGLSPGQGRREMGIWRESVTSFSLAAGTKTPLW